MVKVRVDSGCIDYRLVQQQKLKRVAVCETKRRVIKQEPKLGMFAGTAN